MGKFEKRRFFRSMRRAKVPFLVAHWLSRKPAWELAWRDQASLPSGFSMSCLTFCECCGPEVVRLTEEKTGRTWDFSYFTGKLREQPEKG